MGKELPTRRGFSFETAAEHLHTRAPVASRSSPVDEIRRSLGEKGYDSLTHIAILEGTKLVGVLTDSLGVGGIVSGISYLASGRNVPNVDQVVGGAYIAPWKVPGLARTNELREQLKSLPHEVLLLLPQSASISIRNCSSG